MRNKYRQASSHHHVTWICTLTAVRNFLSLTPTPPHPHIHLSNMTPQPTRKRPGYLSSSRKPDPTVSTGFSFFSESISSGPLLSRHLFWYSVVRLFLCPFHLSPALQSEKDTGPWISSMLCGSPCCFSGC